VTTFWASQIWLNSCDVVLIGDGLDYAAGVFTILAVGFAAEVPPLGAVMGAAAGVLLIEKTYLLAVARKSDVLAVKLSQNFAGWTTLKPQPA
jgi:hypothetical protein